MNGTTIVIDFATGLQRRMDELGLRQSDVAEIIGGYDQTTVGRWLKGEAPGGRVPPLPVQEMVFHKLDEWAARQKSIRKSFFPDESITDDPKRREFSEETMILWKDIHQRWPKLSEDRRAEYRMLMRKLSERNPAFADKIIAWWDETLKK